MAFLYKYITMRSACRRGVVIYSVVFVLFEFVVLPVVAVPVRKGLYILIHVNKQLELMYFSFAGKNGALGEYFRMKLR